MKLEIASFLQELKPAVEESAVWRDGQMFLSIRTYLGSKSPPLEYVTSVRCVLLHKEAVLVVHSTDGTYHILPGGRREDNESVKETLRREVLEEAGWTIKGESLLGFMHFHHLSPKPEGYTYPYPDFFQLVFRAQAETHLPHRRELGEWEQDSAFHPYAKLAELDLSPSNRLFLNAALATPNRYAVPP